MSLLESINDPSDLAYLQRHFRALALLCFDQSQDPQVVLDEVVTRRHPGPRYVATDCTWHVPPDYFDLEIDRERFVQRYITAVGVESFAKAVADAEEVWTSYLTGVYGACLRQPAPENIARKRFLVDKIGVLLQNPEPDTLQWLNEVRSANDDRGLLEREFTPVCDRQRFGRLRLVSD